MIPQLRAKESGSHDTVTLKIRKVLVIDEALPIRRTILDALHKLGINASEVVTVANAEDALEAFVQVKPTLVFTEFVGEILEEGRALVCEMLAIDPHVRVVLVTAEARDSPVVRAAIRCGAFAYLEKPLRHEKIRQVISEIEAETGGIERFR